MRDHQACRVFVFVALLVLGGSVFQAAFSATESTPPQYTANDLTLLIAYVLLALCVSFLCSVAEAVLLSITPSYIEGLKEKQPQRARLLKRLRQDNVDRSLAAILTLNTIAHTVGAIVAGAQAVIVFGSASIGLFSAAMTLLILYLSEIIPKTIGAVYWTKLTGVTAVFVRCMIKVLYPLIWVSEGLTRVIARGKEMHVFSRTEFIAMANIGEQTGGIHESESRIIRNLFRFGSLKAADVMTPRTVIAALPQDISVTDAIRTAMSTPFSRLPVYGRDIDDVTGFVLKDEIVMSNVRGQGNRKLESLKRAISCVPEVMPLSNLMEFFLDHRRHIALVVDEYGGTKGLVTLEDVVETLLGMEIIDEMDKVEDMRVLARQKWEQRAKSLGIEVGKPEDYQGGQDVAPGEEKPPRED